MHVGAVDIRNALSRSLDLRLSSTVIFDYPTPAALSEHIAALLQARASPPRAASATPTSDAADSPPTGTKRLVGVTAAVYRLPGSGNGGTATPLSGLLPLPTDSGNVLPLARWDVDTAALTSASDAAHSNPVSQIRFAHLLRGVDTFDSRLFGSTGVEAALVDPQQRLLLECVAEAILPAGCSADAVQHDVSPARQVRGFNVACIAKLIAMGDVPCLHSCAGHIHVSS